MTDHTIAWRPTAAPEVRRFLEGPRPRGSELLRAMAIFAEFMRGFRALHFVGPCVTVFGSARFKEEHPYYALARGIGAGLARLGFTVVTGGGPGIMEAANRGAQEAGGRSIGCNIELPAEQKPNAYLDRFITFRHFFVRKVMLMSWWRRTSGGRSTIFSTDHWSGMGVIDPVDADRILVVDSAEAAVAAVRDGTITPFGLRYGGPKRRWFLNE